MPTHFSNTLLLTAALWIIQFSSATAQNLELRFGNEIPPEVDTIYERGLNFLAQAQSKEGNWQDGNSGAGVDGLCLMAFLASGEDPNYGRYANNVRLAIRHIVKSQQANTGYFPSSMYHHGFAMLALSEAYGAVDEDLVWPGTEGKPASKPSIAKALSEGIRCAITSQKKNRWGAWRYSPDSNDADTSVAGAVLMGLLAARNAGMEVPDDAITAAMDYINRSTGRDGSVAYSGGFGGMGESMNRSAIATLVSAVSKEKNEEKYQATLKHITTRLDHREGSYKEYFRYYMAQALFQGDYDSWKKWNAETIRQLSQAQREDGSFDSGSYGTAMSLLALALNYRFLPIYER
jgi:hypothetical protein